MQQMQLSPLKLLYWQNVHFRDEMPSTHGISAKIIGERDREIGKTLRLLNDVLKDEAGI